MSEVKTKLEKIRRVLSENQLGGVRLKGVDWFAWATGGGNSCVIMTSEIGIAEVFVTADHAYVLTNRIERDRLAEEEVSDEFEMVAFPWEQADAATAFVTSMLGGKTCVSDRPTGSEKPMPFALQALKFTLLSEEIERYRKVGKLAAEAMTEAMMKAQSDWTENQLAGEGAKSLWSRGLDPTLVMVGNHRRIQIHRHPIAGSSQLGDAAMMVFCARGYGLFANLTRFIYFRDPTADERKRIDQVAQVEAAVFDNSVNGRSLTSMYKTLQEAYANLGQPEEIHKHHQGGPTGYLSREQIASPESATQYTVKNSMALAWNPSLPGAKIEDTVLVTVGSLEILTVDPKWPTIQVSGRARPDVWVKK